nr:MULTISPECIES: MATE family efflux transporter [unclassified Fusobacterium]
MIGFNQGTQPILSYNLGAENYPRIGKLLKISFILLTGIQIFFYILVNLANRGIVSIFLNDSKTIELTVNALRLYSLAYLISGFNIFTAGYFTAINRVKISTIITLLRGIILLVVFLHILPGFWGATGIWLSVPVTELVTLLVSFIYLKKFNPLKKI